jgi:uncharacterized protein (TIGR03435 family)
MLNAVAGTKPIDHGRARRWVMVGIVCLGGGLLTSTTWAQAPAASSADATHKIEDTWQGTLHIPQANRDLRIVLKVKKDEKGALKVSTYSIDQGGQEMPADKASFDDGEFKFAIQAGDINYDGKMAGDGKSIAGTFTQGPTNVPLLFERATPETEWVIPPPPKRLPPMAADADPSFEVATIKPSKPDQPGKLFGVQGNHFRTVNTTLADMIKFAYGVQDKQIIGAPSWVESDKWDIEAQPDAPGAPNKDQLTTMMRKLLADRYQLKFHKETKEMPAYLLTVAKTGQKMKASTSENSLPALFFRGLSPVTLTVVNATMENVCDLFQSAVLDRPVVDQTALKGKWDFLLKWTADDSQFGGMGVKVPPPSEAADAPPPLFTAIQEQIGLKLEAGKANVPVYVIDKAEKPSPN